MSTDTNVIDAATAESILIKDRNELAEAKARASAAVGHLNELVIGLRPTGILTVDEMAEALGRNRNFIDTLWSAHNDAVLIDGKVKQTRVPLADVSDATREAAVKSLADAAEEIRAETAAEDTLRAMRNRNVAMVYGAAIKGFGPSAIARSAGIDRNHALRLARAAGIKPVWRAAGTSRNQWTVSK